MKKSWIIWLSLFIIATVIPIVIGILVQQQPTLNNGTWTGSAEGYKGPITISITVEKGKITDAKLISTSDSEFAYSAINAIIAQTITKGSVKKLDAISGATATSRGAIGALEAASKAAEK